MAQEALIDPRMLLAGDGLIHHNEKFHGLVAADRTVRSPLSLVTGCRMFQSARPHLGLSKLDKSLIVRAP